MQNQVNRSIASDCQTIVKEIISPILQEERLQAKNALKINYEKISKLKNATWNKIISAHEFEHFNEQEYFRWIEIYKDAKFDLSDVNPVSIEQKIALIEVINGRLTPTTLSSEKKLSIEVQRISALKLKKIQEHMVNFNLNSKVNRDDLNKFSSDLLIILKSPPVSLLEYFTKNKTKAMNEKLMRIVQEDMLLIGLKGMVDRIPEKKSLDRLERGIHLTKIIFQYKAWKKLVSSSDLPWVEKVNIPEELLEKMMFDGLDAHDQELITHLKNQNMIDHYERVRKVYKPIAFSIGFYFYYDYLHSKISKELTLNSEVEKKKILEEFSNLSESVVLVPNNTKAIIDEN